MEKIYLFDWGDTLMVDIPGAPGKMCDWPEVKMVEGADKALASISQHSKIYIATNAENSNEEDIRKAFTRVGLSQFITGYFCRVNVGIAKGSRDFYLRIAGALNVTPESLTMVGDTFEKDIQPAIEAGLSAIWFNPKQQKSESLAGYTQVKSLTELCNNDATNAAK